MNEKVKVGDVVIPSAGGFTGQACLVHAVGETPTGEPNATIHLITTGAFSSTVPQRCMKIIRRNRWESGDVGPQELRKELEETKRKLSLAAKALAAINRWEGLYSDLPEMAGRALADDLGATFVPATVAHWKLPE